MDGGAQTVETNGVAHAVVWNSKDVGSHRDMKFVSAGNMTGV